jgi:hypothetical protein
MMVLLFQQSTKVQAIAVAQKLGEIEELGDQLLDIAVVLLRRRAPCLLDRVEHAVGVVEVAALQLQEKLRERLHADQVPAKDAMNKPSW